METSDTRSNSRLASAVGRAIKKSRLSKGYTLADCAQKAGVSATMISKIERGASAPSLSTLESIANALDVPVANFFSATIDRKEVSFVPLGKGMDVRRRGSTYGYDYQLIGRAVSGDRTTEAFIVTIRDTAAGHPMFSNAGLEFVQILEGAMTYQIGGETYELRSGDCLTFDAEAPHGPVEVSTRTVRYLYVTYSE